MSTSEINSKTRTVFCKFVFCGIRASSVRGPNLFARQPRDIGCESRVEGRIHIGDFQSRLIVHAIAIISVVLQKSVIFNINVLPACHRASDVNTGNYFPRVNAAVSVLSGLLILIVSVNVTLLRDCDASIIDFRDRLHPVEFDTRI